MDLSSSSLRRVNDEPDPAIMLFGKRIKGPSTTDAAEIKEALSPRRVDEGGVSFGTSSDEEEELRNNPNAETNEDEIKPGGGSKAMGSQAKPKPGVEKLVRCPRCHSADTKFCYFNNYNVNQPRHFCKHCQRYWTSGGTLRNVPVGAGKRKSAHTVRKASPPLAHDGHSPPSNLGSFLRNVQTNLDLFAGARPNLQFERSELGPITPNPQRGFSGLDEIKTNSQSGFSGLGKISLNLQSQFSRLGETKANLQSTSSGLSEMNFNLQSGFSGFAQIDAKLQSGIPGFGEIKANLQSEIYRLGEVEASQQCVFSGFGQSDANLQSGSGQNKANLYIGCTESNTIMINSPSGGNGSSEMKDHLQGSSEIDSRGYSGLSEIKAHSTGECTGFSKIKAPLFRFHDNEPHLSLGNSSAVALVNNTEGSFRNNCLQRVSCHEAHNGWYSGPCFHNMYWATGMPQQGLMAWPHLAPMLTPQGWGLSCVGAMTTPICAAAPTTASVVVATSTSVAPPTTTPPLPFMLGKRTPP